MSEQTPSTAPSSSEGTSAPSSAPVTSAPTSNSDSGTQGRPSVESRIQQVAESRRARGVPESFELDAESVPDQNPNKHKNNPDVAPGAPSTAPQEPAQEPSFSPSYKFKAWGKEYEIPEQFRGIIKDPETQRAVAEVFERAYGLDHLKPLHEELKNRYTQTDQTLRAVLTRIQPVQEAISRAQNGDTGGIQSLVDGKVLDERTLLQWAVNRAQYYQAPPEQQAILDARMTAERQALEASRKLYFTEQTALTQLHQAKMQLLDHEISKPEVSALAQTYDSAPGNQPGAFKERVREFAEYVHLSTGRDLTPQEAVREFVARFGALMPQHAQAPGAQATASGTQFQQPPQSPPQAQVPPAPPAPPQPQAPSVKVIPNVQGQNSSPTKQRIRRISDLTARYNEISRREA